MAKRIFEVGDLVRDPSEGRGTKHYGIYLGSRELQGAAMGTRYKTYKHLIMTPEAGLWEFSDSNPILEPSSRMRLVRPIEECEG